MRAFVAAFQFLTRLPLSVRFIWSDTLAARSLVWFPVVGFFIGCLLVLLATGLPMLFPLIISALLFVAIWVALTGALHLDGLLDTADGLLSHRSRERMLEIMKDSRIGAMGAITCFFYLALKTAAVCFIIENPTLLNLGCLMLTPAISRWMLTLAITTRPYIRDKQGMGH